MNLENEGPGMRTTAARAKIEGARESSLGCEYRTARALAATLIWHRGGGSIERLETMLREGWA